jgi:hypothetical protein
VRRYFCQKYRKYSTVSVNYEAISKHKYRRRNMTSGQNGGGGGCITVTVGDVKHTHAIVSLDESPPSPVRLSFDLPHADHAHGTNGGGGGCIRVKIAGVEHTIACKPTDEIELQFDFRSA